MMLFVSRERDNNSLLKARRVFFQERKQRTSPHGALFCPHYQRKKRLKNVKIRKGDNEKANNKQKRNTLLKRKNAKHFEASKQGKKREVKVYLYNNCNGYQPKLFVYYIITTKCNQEVLFHDY